MNIEAAHEHVKSNIASIGLSTNCGCGYCLRIFPATEVKRFVDAGKTGICPYCGIDALLPDVIIDFNPEFLKKFYTHWFT